MNLKEALLEEHSKAQCQLIADYVGNDPDRFSKLIDVFLSKEGPYDQRAAMVVDILLRENPRLADPHLDKFVAVLSEEVHDAIKRAVLRYLQFEKIQSEHIGDLADACFGFLESPHAAIAIRAFSMTVLYNISQVEPDLKRELNLVIEAHLPYGSAGFKNRGQKILKKLERDLRRQKR